MADMALTLQSNEAQDAIATQIYSFADEQHCAVSTPPTEMLTWSVLQ
jgi:hypothetical protein